MIKPSDALIQFVESQAEKESLAKRLGVTLQTIYNLTNAKYNVSAPLIAKILNETGFEFEKAFEVKED